MKKKARDEQTGQFAATEDSKKRGPGRPKGAAKPKNGSNLPPKKKIGRPKVDKPKKQ